MVVKNCWNCFTGQQKYRCKGCGLAEYCSEICQKEHWKHLHKSHCKYLSGKIVLPGSFHSQETCYTCQKESVDCDETYRNLHKKDSPDMACHIRGCNSYSYIGIFKEYFLIMTRYKMDYEKAENEKATWTTIHLPFEFGEICGEHAYLDFFDKTLGYISTLLIHLVFRYTSLTSVTERIHQILNQIIKLRAYHWAVSLVCEKTSKRIEKSSSFFAVLINSEKVLELHEIIGKNENQNGIATWHSFIFIYEMLGISSWSIWLLLLDSESLDNEEETKSFVSGTEFKHEIMGNQYSIHTDSIFDQISSLEKQMDFLAIFDDNFQLKPFHKILEQFFAGNKDSQFSCELCKTPVDYKNCDYVFHSLHLIDVTWMETNLGISMDLISKSNASQTEAGKPYLTYTIGSGLRVICNTGGCKNIYSEHVFTYRNWMNRSVVDLVAKYKFVLSDYICWVCNKSSNKSHRCRKCQSRLYCSPECQTKDWKMHKTICRRLKEAGTQVKGDSQARRGCADTLKEHLEETLNLICECGKKECLYKSKQNDNSLDEVD